MSLQYDAIDTHDAAKEYYKIPLFEDQCREIPTFILQAAAAIFVQHNAHHTFGISLLHRHLNISQDHVMVHSIAKGADICRPQELGLQKMYPCLHRFCSERKRFMPVEYDEKRPAKSSQLPDRDFLSSLADFLSQHKLETVLGLSWLSASSEIWIERRLPGGQGTIATRSQKELHPDDGTITEWSFTLVDDYPRARAVRQCTTKEKGDHE